MFFYVASDRRTKDAWRKQFGKLTQNIGQSSSNNLDVDPNKMKNGKKLTINNSVSVPTMAAGMTNGGHVDDEDSMKSDEDNESAPHSTPTADMNVPLKENHDPGEAKEGIVNPAIDKEGEGDDLANKI